MLVTAVKVTAVPEQVFPAGFAVMFTVGVKFEFTTMLIILEVATVDVRQLPLAIVISQLTVFPLARVEEVKILEAPF